MAREVAKEAREQEREVRDVVRNARAEIWTARGLFSDGREVLSVAREGNYEGRERDFVGREAMGAMQVVARQSAPQIFTDETRIFGATFGRQVVCSERSAVNDDRE